jgi:hypothetical protein
MASQLDEMFDLSTRSSRSGGVHLLRACSIPGGHSYSAISMIFYNIVKFAKQGGEKFCGKLEVNEFENGDIRLDAY